MMPDKWKKTFQMRIKQREYKKRISEATTNIKQILNSPYKPIIEYSGGKDSIVLTHLIMQQNNKIPVFNHHPGYGKYSKQIYRTQKTHKEIMSIAKKLGVKDITVTNTPFCTPDPNDYLIQDYFPELFKVMEKKHCDLELLGIRGEESINRRHRVKGPLIRQENHRTVAFPIRYLSWMDIWTYITEKNLPYPHEYDIRAQIVGYDKVRFTSTYNENALYQGGSYYLDGVLFPEGRNEIAKPGDHWDKNIQGGDNLGQQR